MTAVLVFLLREVIGTLRDPRTGAQRVMALEIPRQQRWEILVLVAVFSAFLAFVSVFVGNLTATEPSEFPIMLSPLMLGVSQLVVMLVMVFAIHIVGNWAGGMGELDDAILLVAWMQFILICLQIAQIAAALVLPVLALLLGLAGLVLVFVLLTIFVAELHGFRSLSRVFFAVLFVMLVLATIVRFVFGLFGFDVIGVL